MKNFESRTKWKKFDNEFKEIVKHESTIDALYEFHHTLRALFQSLNKLRKINNLNFVQNNIIIDGAFEALDKCLIEISRKLFEKNDLEQNKFENRPIEQQEHIKTTLQKMQEIYNKKD